MLGQLRSVINYVSDSRSNYSGLCIIYGTRTPYNLVFLQELVGRKKDKPAGVPMTVDVNAEGWKGSVGFVPQYLLDLKPAQENTIAITFIPPIMIKFVLQSFVKLGFKDKQVYTTL